MPKTLRMGAGAVATAVLAGCLTFGAAAPASAESPFEGIKLACMHGNKDMCEAVYDQKPIPENVKNCLVKGAVAGAGAIVIGRINKTLAKKLAKETVTAGATACVAAIT